MKTTTSIFITLRGRGSWRLPLLASCITFSAAAQAPAVTTLSPGRNANAASRTSPLGVTFTQAIDPATASNIKVFSSQYRGQRAATARTSGAAVTLAPLAAPPGAAQAAFRPGELVSVTVPAAVRSTGGQAALPQVYQFTTAVGGTGRGTFGDGADLAMPVRPNAVALADVDNDGDLDLLVPQNVTYGTLVNLVAVQLNDGRGTFGPSTDVPVANPFDLTMADVDGDGDLDLLTASSVTKAVSVRLNNGRGVFSGGSEVPMVPPVTHVLAADVDGDGDLDLLAYTHLNGQTVLSIRLNRGNGTFANGSELAIDKGTGTLTVGDVDSDGDLDLLSTDFTGGAVLTCLNQGAGTFASPTSLAMPNNPTEPALADVDQDGDLDLVVGCAGNNTVATRLNDGHGQFASSGPAVAVGKYPQNVRLADVDSDGDLDLLTANLFGGSVSIRFNTNGTFGGGSDVALGQQAYGLAVGDVDGDDDLDFATAIPVGASSIKVRLNLGPAAPPPAPVCPAVDSAGLVSPAGLVVLSCGQAQTTLRVSAAQPAGTRYDWQYAPTLGAPWQPLAAANGQPTYQASQGGLYRVRLTQGSCVATSVATEVRIEPLQAVQVPTIFTPNHDQLNDAFVLRLQNPRAFHLQVFNRWGREVFSTNQYGDFWTGAGAPAGVYYYLWRYATDCDPTEHTVKGTITLAQQP